MFTGRGTTTVRSRFARKLENRLTDQVMFAIPIPPGSTIEGIHMNHLSVGATAMELEKAMEVNFHAFLVTDIKPYHGYGEGIDAYDTMWDDLIPKDGDPDFSLDDQDENSFIGRDSQGYDDDGGSVEGGVSTTNYEGGTTNLKAVLNAGIGPELLFSRVKRLDVSNGIISESNKFTAIDKFVTDIKRRIAVPRDRYGWLMGAVGSGAFEVASSYSNGRTFEADNINDIFWMNLAHPELAMVSGLIMPDSNNALEVAYGDMIGRNLELAEIESDTYHDLNQGDGAVDLINYTNCTVTYRRPSWERLNLTSRDTA